MDIEDYNAKMRCIKEKHEHSKQWRELFKTYIYDTIGHLRDLYKEATGLVLCEISMQEIKMFLEKGVLRHGNCVYMLMLHGDLFCYPGEVLCEYFRPLEWPWAIPTTDYTVLGKDVWSVIINPLSIKDKATVSRLDRRFNSWLKEDVFWKEHRTFIDTRFTIYSRFSVVETFRHICALRNEQYYDWMDFIFCFCFQFPLFQQSLMPGKFISNDSDNQYTKRKVYENDVFKIEIKRWRKKQSLDVFFNGFNVHTIDKHELRFFIKCFKDMDCCKVYTRQYVNEAAYLAQIESFLESESKTKKLKRSF